MNTKRTILYIISSILVVILLYNYLYIPLFAQPNRMMGMGMHERMMGNNNFSTLYGNTIFFIAILAVGIIFYYFIRSFNMQNKCGKCGLIIENNRWRICPICGTTIKHRKGDEK